jgi:hypothetical protein
MHFRRNSTRIECISEGIKDVSFRIMQCNYLTNEAYFLSDSGLLESDSGVTLSILSVAHSRVRRSFHDNVGYAKSD